MSKKDIFHLDISSLQRPPPRRSKRLNKEIIEVIIYIIFELIILCIHLSLTYLRLFIYNS